MTKLFASVLGISIFLAPAVFADPGGVPHCPPTSNSPFCRASLPEPSSVPELALCLALTGGAFLLSRRNRRSSEQ